jgi:hypothetical protein
MWISKSYAQFTSSRIFRETPSRALREDAGDHMIAMASSLFLTQLYFKEE